MGWEDNEAPPKAPINTNPYRPPVRLTSSDDTALVVKSSEELPSGVRGQSESHHERETESERRRPGSGDSHVDTIQRMAEPDEGPCRRQVPH